MVRLQNASLCIQGIRFERLLKLEIFEAQEFASLAATPGPDLSQTARKADSYPAQRGRDSQSMQGDAFEDQWDHHGRVKYHLKLSGSIAG